MSRVGKKPVNIPADVKVQVDGSVLKFAKGSITEEYKVDDCISFDVSGNVITFKPNGESKCASAIWGTTQKNVSNIVHGLSSGFTMSLDLVGVGYKANVQGKKLVLELGYSHNIEYEIPAGVTITCPKPTSIVVSGHSKKQVGDVAALIKTYRKVEPYKGKGVIRAGDFVYRKEGKKK